MLLGLISLLLAQSARWISEICVNSSLFTSQFYICSDKDYSNTNEKDVLETSFSSPNVTDIPAGLINLSSHQCGEVKCFANVDSISSYACIYLASCNGWLQGREPFVSYEGLEQLHRFLFVLGITHVLYSCVAVGLAMSKVESLYFSFSLKQFHALSNASWICPRVYRFTVGGNGKIKLAYWLMRTCKVCSNENSEYFCRLNWLITKIMLIQL